LVAETIPPRWPGPGRSFDPEDAMPDALLTMTDARTDLDAPLAADVPSPADAPASDDDELEPWAYPGLGALIRSDIQVWGEMFAFKRRDEPVRLLTAIRLILVYAGLRTALIHRLAYACHRAGIRIIPMILTNLNLSLHGFDMPPNIEIGPRFFVPHPVGTVVTARRIGASVTLVSAITIGMRKESDFPLLGDDVYVGAGARILGAITIGDRAQIGANAVVLKDVPADHVAIGVPATIRPARSDR
jgi:serine O-acetyltransferase